MSWKKHLGDERCFNTSIACIQDGMSKEVAPQRYVLNPLASGDEQEYMSTMFRLVTDTFLLVRGEPIEEGSGHETDA